MSLYPSISHNTSLSFSFSLLLTFSLSFTHSLSFTFSSSFCHSHCHSPSIYIFIFLPFPLISLSLSLFIDFTQALDKADNMLNSGSYGDFDQLIGEMNLFLSSSFTDFCSLCPIPFNSIRYYYCILPYFTPLFTILFYSILFYYNLFHSILITLFENDSYILKFDSYSVHPVVICNWLIRS